MKMLSGTYDIRKLGPYHFFDWLVSNWYKSDGISTDTKEAMKVITGQDEPDRYSVHCLDYEKMIFAIAEEDLVKFVHSRLEGIEGFSLSISDLKYKGKPLTLSTLRAVLGCCFRREHIFPQQGLLTLLREASEAISAAKDALLVTNPDTNLIVKHQGTRAVHDGVDRAMVATERYLELLLEFLATLAREHFNGSQEQWKKWTDEIEKSWCRKEMALVGISKHLASQMSVEAIPMHIEQQVSQFSAYFLGCSKNCLEVHCRETKEKKRGNCHEDAGEVLRLLSRLRLSRNNLRHASHTMNQGINLPKGYYEAVRSAYECLQKLIDIAYRQHPIVVKIASYQRDMYGHIDMLLATEEKRLITASFSSLVNTTRIQPSAIGTKLNVEFFLFPAPDRESSHNREPILVERDQRFVKTELPVLEYELDTPDTIQELTHEEELLTEDEVAGAE